MENPYQSPEAVHDSDHSLNEHSNDVVGMGQIAFLKFATVLFVIYALVTAEAIYLGLVGVTHLGIALVFSGLSIPGVYRRLENIGMNPKHCMLMLVPIVNLVIGVICLVCPERMVQPPREFNGMGRLAFFGILVAFDTAQTLTVLALFVWGYPQILAAIVPILSALLALYPFYSRLENIGSNPNWCWLLFVPIINLLLIVRCLMAPEDYAHTRKLDTAGTVIATLFLIALLIAIAVALKASFQSLSGLLSVTTY